MEIFILGVVVVVGLVILSSHWTTKKRRDYLMLKYNSAAIVQRIMAHNVWQGMSKEQLVDSWGKPIDVGTKVYKTKTIEVCKYNQTGKNRFGSRVTVENGTVIGWEQK